jgi:NADPH:quinone reductase
MRAAVIVPGNDGGVVEIQDLPEPKPGAGQILIRVRASALNRSEIGRKQALKLRPGDAQKPERDGIECAGEVAETGAGVTAVKTGDRVMCRCNGGHAEYVTIDQRGAMPVPSNLNWEQAAAIPNTFVTAHDALTASADLKPGESVLVNAASSGVGVAAIQIARVFGAKPVIGTSGSQTKLERLAALGLDAGILTSDDLVAQARAATDGKGVDVIIDNVGGTVFPENLRAMAYKGRLVQVGRLASSTSEIDLDFLARWRMRIIGTSFRQRSAEESLAASVAFKQALLPAIADGRLKPVVDRVFPLAELAKAHDYMETNAQLGKIVITM